MRSIHPAPVGVEFTSSRRFDFRDVFAPQRPRLSRFAMTVFISSALFICALPARAATDTETGNTGTMGTSGAVNTDQNGQNGGPGQSVTADAGVTIPNTDATNTATAHGGQGGSGGNGGGTISGLGAGGNGGLGGNATAQSMTSITLGDGSASSYAQGGTGGFGGSGGQFEQYGLTGAGSNGGNATATAFAQAPGDVIVTATAAGGPGGEPGIGTNAVAGSTGGTASLTANGISTGGGNVSVTGILSGGGGGQADGGFTNFGANGGNGIDASLNNAVSGTTTGTLTLEQTVYGGSAGVPIGQPSGESAGAATSSLSYSAVTAAVVNAYATANGGGGAGAIENAGGGDGNTANASANISGIGAINVTATGTGGTGGDSYGAYSIGSAVFAYQAGNGTSAIATASGTSTTGQPVVVTAIQTAGDGGTGYYGANAGNGADSIMNNAVSGATSGGLTLIQQATAGYGGLSESGSAGLAGMAVSNLTVNQSTETGGITVQSTANGGMGGSGWQYFANATNATQGGNASASVNVTDIGDINASVSAFGGPGGNAVIGAGNSGNGGFGTVTAASATSTGTGAHTVMLTVTEQGGDGGEELPPGGPESVPPVPANGGNGQSASLNGVANPNVGAAGTIFVLQNAIGGDAGGLYDGGTGSPGTAGSGTAELGLDREIANLNVTDDASGGSGANSTPTAGPTPGGNAYATSSATDNSGTPNAFATADGGEGGGGYNSEGTFVSAYPGTAYALATASSTLSNAYPTASATASGHTPSASAIVNAAAGGGSAQALSTIITAGDEATAQSTVNVDGLLISANGVASATCTNLDYSQTQTDVFVTQPTPGLASAGTFQACVNMDALPTAAQASLALGSTHPNSAAAVAGSTDFLGMTVLSDMHSLASFSPVAASETQSSDSEYVFDLSDLPSNTRDLIVCLLDNQISGAGFATLDFQIDANGSLIPGQNYNFTSPTTAATFFSDNPISLGPIINFDSGGQLKLDIDMSVTTENSGDGFTADLLIANTGLITVPEPAGAFLIAPLVALAWRRRAVR